MEFLSLSCRRFSARNIPSGEERGETDVFTGYFSTNCKASTTYLKCYWKPWVGGANLKNHLWEEYGYFLDWHNWNFVLYPTYVEYMLYYPGPRGFSWFFFAKEIKSKPQSGDNESRKRRGERGKPLVTLTPNLTFMQTTAVKCVKLLIKRVNNCNLANTCLSVTIFLIGGRPGEIMLWTNHLHLGPASWWVICRELLQWVSESMSSLLRKGTYKHQVTTEILYTFHVRLIK